MSWLARFTDLVEERAASAQASEISTELATAAGDHSDAAVRTSLADESSNWGRIARTLREMGQ